MSPPTDELERLSIGGIMTTTRQQAQQARRERERQERQRITQERQQYQEIAAASPSMIIQGHTGVLYDIRSMSPRSQGIAKRGLNTDSITVDFLRKHAINDNRSVCAFQMKEAHSVRIFDPAGGNLRVTCTCAEFVRAPSTAVCVHIFWLYDGLNHVLAGTPREHQPGQLIDRSRIEHHLSGLYHQVSTNLDKLPDRLNDTWDDDEEDEGTHEMIQDMLALLDPENFWDNYDEEFEALVPEASTKSFQDLVVPGSMPVTIFALAKHDPIFRDRLRNAITKEMCSKDIWSKLKAKTTVFLRAFDDYVERGPTFEPRFVARTAGSLRQVINKLSTYRKGARAPLSPIFDRYAAELAVFILAEVSNRSENVYKDSPWYNGSVPESESDGNLLVNLITSPPASVRSSSFVLDFLGDELPPSSYKDFLARLDPIAAKLREDNAPRAYIQKLLEIINGSQNEEGDLEDFEQHATGPERHRGRPSSRDQWPHSQSTTPRPSPMARRPTLDDPQDRQRRRLA